ncbi:MAG: trypsin-like peptidase domain-containing protein [Candidatus Nealsonbacteria bacterium]
MADPQAEYVVVLENDKTYPVEILAKDPINDVAIIKIKEKGLPTVKLGDSSKLELGQTAIAIGNVLGLFRNTVSVGVVSGLSREIMAGDTLSNKQTKLRGLIQTDTAINPGNSGGPLINIEGKAIGINTAMVFLAENVGFALPINNAKKDLDDLKKHGRIRQPFLGIRYILLNKEMQEKFNLPACHGAFVISEPVPEGNAVMPGSAAEKAGLKEKDIIIEVLKEKITEKKPIEDILQKCKIGKLVDMKILRNGKEITIKTLVEEKK